MADFRFIFKQQTEQANGFWLSDWQWQDPNLNSKPLPVNAAFELNQIQFQLISQQPNGYQFLANAPVSLTADKSVIRLKNHQAWRFLPELTAFLKFDVPLLITASNQAMATALYLSQQLKNTYHIQVLLHSDAGFPFMVKPARFLWENAPAEAIGAMPLLEDWQIPNRLCHSAFQPGCFEGTLEDFLIQWHPNEQQQIIQCNDFVI